jgi:hypothetical protein
MFDDQLVDPQAVHVDDFHPPAINKDGLTDARDLAKALHHQAGHCFRSRTVLDRKPEAFLEFIDGHPARNKQ